MYIEKAKRNAAEKVLVDNGIARDEAATVLQALGYVLLDTELYDEPVKDVRINVSMMEYLPIETDLFFLEIPCRVTSETLNAAITKMLPELDDWYGNTDQNTEDWVLEYSLWARMLLHLGTSENGVQTLNVMLNPVKLDISDPEQENCLLEFIATISGNEWASTYKTLRRSIPSINAAWERTGEEEPSFLYHMDNEEGTALEATVSRPSPVVPVNLEVTIPRPSAFSSDEMEGALTVETPVGTIIASKFVSDETPGIAIDFKRKGDIVADPVALVNYDDCSRPEWRKEHTPDMDMCIRLWRSINENYTDSFRLPHLSKPYPTEL